MPLILPGNVASALGGAYEVANSCRFNGGEYMHKSLSATATHADKCTFSIWVKPQVSDNRNTFVAAGVDSGNYMKFRLQDDKIALYGNRSSGNDLHVVTNRVFRDPSAFYHILLQVDTTQSTSTDRVKFFVNGVQETSMSTTTYMAQNADCFLNGGVSSSKLFIGAFDTAADAGVSEQGEGYFAEVALIDGSILAPTEFGEYDEDSPTIWKPKDISGLTFGANGFYLDFEDSSNLGNDANGGTDLTEANLAATDQCTDTPTNNFATMNPLNNRNGSYSEGNISVWNSGQWRGFTSSIGMTTGKWYAEFKITGTNVQNGVFFGVGCGEAVESKNLETANTGYLSYRATGFERQAWSNNKVTNNTATSGYGTAMAENNIGMIAFDATNGTIWTGVNGTWDNSATSSEIAAGTTTNAMFKRSDSPGVIAETYFFGCSIEGTSVTGLVNWNFGNPAYAISSGNADANGYGNMEYSIPSGYYTLCTKNLAEFG